MAVEARHMNIFPQQIITNRECMNMNQVNNYGYNDNNLGTVIFDGTTMAENLLPFNQSVYCEATNSMKAESGLTYNLPSVPRKRSRDSMNELHPVIVPQKQSHLHDSQQSLPIQMHQQCLEIDQIIAQHTKKIRMELEERQTQQTRTLVSAIGEGLMKKLQEKDDHIQKMLRMNLALQERVKNLFLENQLWKDLAQTNEATVISLRCNLEQVLTQVSDDRHFPAAGNAEEEAESCGSSGHGEEGEEVFKRRRVGNDAPSDGGFGNRMCRKCGERESCVLILPCRHLCLCTVCGTTSQSKCPVCNANMNATVHVNVSDKNYFCL
ncbi:BOI-related E3 ubiquitin-protein ligase 1-like [Apium graveolens]|uniref:BOI-related E3 ubiquitin-protein ligase 1-like n=1 Tax=Apium graveolens TaxID=4045 RepID=UPI003D79A99D